MPYHIDKFKNIDLEKIWHFYYAYRLGSLKKAAEKCGVHENVIRHSIKTIEKKLEVELYETSKKNFIPTNFGKTYYQYACEICELTNNYLNEKQGLFTKDSDEIIILTTTTITNFVLPIVLKEFCTNNPGVKVKVFGGPEYLKEPISHPYDLIISGDLASTTLTKKHISNATYHFYASAELVKRMGNINKIEDIKGVEILMFSGHHLIDKKVIEKNNKIIESNSYPFLIHCCHMGLGILSSCFEPSTLTRLGFQLDMEKILPDYISENDSTYAYYNRYTDKKDYISKIIEITENELNKDNKK